MNLVLFRATLSLSCLSDVLMKKSGNKLNIRCWNSGERIGLETDFRL